MNHSLRNIIFSFTVLFIVLSAHAEIHKWVDEQGNIHYSDTKPENQRTEEINIKPHVPFAINNSSEISEIPNTEESTQAPTKPYKKQNKVIMYAASWCGVCKKARAYFNKNKIRFSEYDIEKNINARKRFEKLGGVGVPLIVAKRQQMQGFSVAKFESWYEGL